MPITVKVEAAALETYAGRYEVDPSVMPNAVLDVTVVGGELYLKPSGVERHKLAAVSSTEFFDFDDPGDARYIFERDERGAVKGLRVSGMSPQPFLARRVALPSASLKGNTTFKLKGHEGAKIVALAGTFNEWNQTRTLCAREAGEWVCRVDLAPGKHAYKFVVDGNWMTDPGNPKTEDDGSGNINSVLVKTP